MNLNTIGFTLGLLLLLIGVADFFPALIDYYDGHQNFKAFLMCAFFCLFFGGCLVIANKGHEKNLNIKSTFFLATASWVFLSFFACLPFYFADIDFNITDAFFEAVSGVTTTGSTVMTDLEQSSRGILFWRSLIQWIGGIGIVAFSIILLPFLSIGGMQLFQTESSDRYDKIIPRTALLVRSLLMIYFGLSVCCALLYYWLGMDLFDAVNHAMTTLSTGGFSTHDQSFGYFNSAPLNAVCCLFMILGSIPFILYVKIFVLGQFDIFKDEQFKFFMIILVLVIVVLSLWVMMTQDHSSVLVTADAVAFSVISVITTTGYATVDYTSWGPFSVMVFMMLTYLGACAGSTSGGVKVMRLVLAAKILNRHLKSLIHPRGFFYSGFQGKNIHHELALNVMGFLGAYVLLNVIITLLLSAAGLDFATAISGAATAVANVGPGIGSVIGPYGNFSSLPDSAKWILSAGMILGRLEIMTILVLFHRNILR